MFQLYFVVTSSNKPRLNLLEKYTFFPRSLPIEQAGCGKKGTSDVIELVKAGFTYSGAHIFEELDLRLPKGSFQFLTGPSGSGKTTLTKLCYQALKPTSGTIKLFGQDVRAMNRDDIAMIRRRIGVVHQDCRFLDHLSIADNILLPLQVAGHDLPEHLDNLHQLARWTGLGERMHAKPDELSGGERQRAALARAVIMSPEVIIADEPTGNLDEEMATRLLTLLVELNKMGKTILIATHDMGLIRKARTNVAARVLRIQNKRVFSAKVDA